MSHACHLQYVLLSSFALSPAKRNDGIHGGLLAYYIRCGVCVTSTVDLPHYFSLDFNIHIENSSLGARV